MRRIGLAVASMAIVSMVAILGFGPALASPTAVAVNKTYLPVVFDMPTPSPTPIPTPSRPAPWPMEGHDGTRSGLSTVSGPQSASLEWMSPVTSAYFNYTGSQPAISGDGTIYIESDDRVLYALNPDGSLRWSFPTGAEGSAFMYAPAVAPSGTVYVPAKSGTQAGIIAVDSSGRLLWTFALPGSTPPFDWSALALASDGTILVPATTANGGEIFALHPDGTLAWSRQFSGTTASLAIAPDGTIYVESGGDGLYAIAPDGSLKWKHAASFVADTLPVVGSDGTIYFAASNGGIFAINPNGSLKWNDAAVLASGAFANGPIALGPDGTIYYGSANPYLYALSSDGSTLKWKFNDGTDLFALFPIVGADGTIYVPTGSSIDAVNPDGSLKWESRSLPSVGLASGYPGGAALGADGTLYVGLGDGMGILAAFSPSHP